MAATTSAGAARAWRSSRPRSASTRAIVIRAAPKYTSSPVWCRFRRSSRLRRIKRVVIDLNRKSKARSLSQPATCWDRMSPRTSAQLLARFERSLNLATSERQWTLMPCRCSLKRVYQISTILKSTLRLENSYFTCSKCSRTYSYSSSNIMQPWKP